ncbi:TonB-dependent receptor [Paracoccus yeei]
MSHRRTGHPPGILPDPADGQIGIPCQRMPAVSTNGGNRYGMKTLACIHDTPQRETEDGLRGYVPRRAIGHRQDNPNAIVNDDRLTVGGALRWQSGTDSMDFTSDVEQPNVHQGSFAVFDLNGSLRIDARTELTLSVNNLFDKTYYATTGFYDTVVYGEGRTAELAVRTRF